MRPAPLAFEGRLQEMGRRLMRVRRGLASPRLWGTRLIFWLGAICVGLSIVALTWLAETASAYFMWVQGEWSFAPFIITPLGFVTVLYLTRHFFQGAEGSGIPQVIVGARRGGAVAARLLSFKVAAGKIGLCTLGFLSGASIGREGPSVQIGAAVMRAFGRFAPSYTPQLERSLIMAGGSAGIAAAFNTPLAGIVFAIEELSKSFAQRTNGIVITAVILSGVISLSIWGNYTYFGRATLTTTDTHIGWMVLVCGVTGGVLGGLFARGVLHKAAAFPRAMREFYRAHPYRFAAVCGLLLAAIGWYAGGTTFGTGYSESKWILDGGEARAGYGYGLLKMLATYLSYISGIPGGIFAPSLAVGAGLGSDIASLFDVANRPAIAILCMAAYLAGVTQSPLTTFVIVMEMTAGHAMIMPLMLAALLGSIVSRLITRRLYFTMAHSLMGGLAPEDTEERQLGPTGWAAVRHDARQIGQTMRRLWLARNKPLGWRRKNRPSPPDPVAEGPDGTHAAQQPVVPGPTEKVGADSGADGVPQTGVGEKRMPPEPG